MFDLTFDTDGVAKKFGLEGTLKTAQIIETGHINNTYLLYYDMGGNKYNKYILQNINTNVFKNPAGLMENIVAVTGYLKERIRESGGDPERETLTFLPADNGNYFYADENGRHWRVYRFVDGTYTRDSIDRPETFYDAGEAFGRFQSMLSGFPIETLHDTIPDFHNTKKRFAALREAVENNLSGRLEFARAEVDFALSKEGEASVLVNLSDAGELPMRVTHNDTKLNNVLFDNKTNKGICVIDLDTVMPGLSLYDFGDAIRFGANTAAEDEKDLSKVSLDLSLYEQYTKGYLNACGASFVKREIEYMPFAAKLITYECGIRFLTDYLNGDTYFRIAYPEHNLDRCKTQMELVRDMERKFDVMRDINGMEIC